jgi:zinc transport system substrate-binding protein
MPGERFGYEGAGRAARRLVLFQNLAYIYGMVKSPVYVALVLSLFCAACARKTDTASGVQAARKTQVVATIFPPYDFARAVAADRVELAMLLPPASESHSFEPTPRDILTIQNSALFIYGGGESDAWVEQILGALDTSRMRVISMMDCVKPVEEELVEGMEAEREEEAAYDEHVWTSPKNAMLITQAISAALCAADPVNAGFYRQNTAAYVARLETLDAVFRAVVQDAARKTIVFADRFPFRYFADEYGLSYFAAFPGCSTEAEPAAATVAFLINKIRAEDIPVVFHLELSNERMADTIAEATNAEKRLFHACHNVSRDEFRNGASYIGLMTANAANLREALR